MSSVKPEEMPKGLYNGIKFVFGKFFSTSKEWSWKRNLVGALMVYCPEIPTYFIPAYTQAKGTGNAKDLKKGEGIRGLLTGGLEGMAVGAIVSDKKMNFKTIAPFIVFGAAIQLFSSLTLPIIGEKVGKFMYNKRKYTEKLQEVVDIPFGQDSSQTPITATQKPQPPNNDNPVQFKGSMAYQKFNSGSLKV